MKRADPRRRRREPLRRPGGLRRPALLDAGASAAEAYHGMIASMDAIANNTIAIPVTGPAPAAESEPETPELPVDSYREAAPYLRRPFTAAAVKHKVQASWDEKGGGKSSLIVSYIDARLAIERLNLVCPHLWSDAYEAVPSTSGEPRMWCHLTIDGITRRDVGEGTGKGLVSDALKRAAVHFGVGVSLYAIPKIILSTRDEHLKVKPNRRGEPTVEITPKGAARCRDLYEAWLDVQGRQAFGEPLDHGDDMGAAGDLEVDRDAVPSGEASEPASEPETASGEASGEATESTEAAEGTESGEGAEQAAQSPRIDPTVAATLYDAATAIESIDPDRFRQAVSYVLRSDCGDLTDRAKAIEILTKLNEAGATKLTRWIEKEERNAAAEGNDDARESEKEGEK